MITQKDVAFMTIVLYCKLTNGSTCRKFDEHSIYRTADCVGLRGFSGRRFRLHVILDVGYAVFETISNKFSC